MSKLKNGGPAFPVPGDQQYPEMNGLSLRDWFAGQALQGLLAGGFAPGSSDLDIAKGVYSMADAMLAARKGGDA